MRRSNGKVTVLVIVGYKKLLHFVIVFCPDEANENVSYLDIATLRSVTSSKMIRRVQCPNTQGTEALDEE